MIECPKCGEKLKDNSVICSKCGAKINSKSSSKSNSKIIIAIIVIIAVIAVVGVFASGILNSNSQTHVQNNNVDDTNASGLYWASAKENKFHKPDCEWAQKISQNNKIVYNSREKAIADGKIPCGVCNP